MSVKTQISFLKSLLYIEQIMREGTISRAADKNGLKASNLSKMLKELEKQMDKQLFVRTPQGMVPTKEAKEAALEINRLSKMIDDLARKYCKGADMCGELRLFVSKGLEISASEKVFQKALKTDDMQAADVIVSTEKPLFAESMICVENKIGHQIKQSIFVCAKNNKRAIDFATKIISILHRQ